MPISPSVGGRRFRERLVHRGDAFDAEAIGCWITGADELANASGHHASRMQQQAEDEVEAVPHDQPVAFPASHADVLLRDVLASGIVRSRR